MINREQIQEMIDCYGANLAQWPCKNKEEIAAAIERDAKLSEAYSAASETDQALVDFFEMSEHQWSKTAADKLTEKIIQKLDRPQKLQCKTTFWPKWNWLADWKKQLLTVPAFSTGIAALVLLVAVQLNLNDPEESLKNSHSPFSVAELDEWLIFEGLKSGDEFLTEREAEEVAIFESEEIESSLDPELIFYL